jgi:Phage tail assembly chaperone protein, TAC
VFSDTAKRLAGLTGAVLGWRPDEFWSATPAELAAILGALVQEPVSADAALITKLKEIFPDG